MTKKDTEPESGGAVPGGPDKGRSDADHRTSRHPTHAVSERSEAIIKEVSVRRRTAMKILADR